MQYGRVASSDVWHLLMNGKAMCFASMKIAEVREGVDVDREKACENCDKAFREKGRQARKTARKKMKRPNPKTVYRPRFKLED